VNPIVSAVSGASGRLHESNRETCYKIVGCVGNLVLILRCLTCPQLQPTSYRAVGQKLQKLICETASVTIISRTTYVLCESLSPPLFALPLVFS
jgi:hypothetical protein